MAIRTRPRRARIIAQVMPLTAAWPDGRTVGSQRRFSCLILGRSYIASRGLDKIF
jgi:hypothetical protein